MYFSRRSHLRIPLPTWKMHSDNRRQTSPEPGQGTSSPYARTTGNSLHRVVLAGDFIRCRIRQRSLSSSVA